MDAQASLSEVLIEALTLLSAASTVTIADPPACAVAVFEAALSDAGITVLGEMAAVAAPPVDAVEPSNYIQPVCSPYRVLFSLRSTYLVYPNVHSVVVRGAWGHAHCWTLHYYHSYRAQGW